MMFAIYFIFSGVENMESGSCKTSNWGGNME